MAYVIKRYSNRKLYDTQESRYVTLEEIEEMIRAGKEIAVVDAASGEDLTSVTLAQIILENERNHGAALATAFLHLLRRRLKPLGRARDGLSLTFHELERFLDAVDARHERLLVELRGILRAVRPGALPMRRGALGAPERFEGALL